MCPDGTVIFFQNGTFVRPISRQTGSNLTHVAIVLYDERPWVYEASPPRVNRIPLDDYLKSIRGEFWFMLRPPPFTDEQLAAMKRYAGSQLNRRYMVRGWWKGQETRGIFCSEYVADTIEKSGLIVSAKFHESPGSLYEKLSSHYAPID